MITSLRNTAHPICCLSNVHGDAVSFLISPGFCCEDLQGEAAKVQASALSEGTKHNYSSVWSLYDKFTRFYNLKPFPATPETLSSFITSVGFSVKSHKTVHNYILALHKLHDLCLFDSTAFDDIRVKLTLKGLEKLKRHIPLCKLPNTPDMLLKFRSHLDFRNSAHLALWAALLVGFFTFFRTAKICPPSRETFSCFSTLSCNDITFTSWGAAIIVMWTKTRQSGDTALVVPIPYTPNSNLCPVKALQALFQAVHVPPSAPAF